MEDLSDFLKGLEKEREKAREVCQRDGHVSDDSVPSGISGSSGNRVGTYVCFRCGELYIKCISPKQYDTFWEHLKRLGPIGAGV